MNLMLFKYGLPLIIGYVLFVGIAGQFQPLRKPGLLPRRPSWLLGLWAGTSVAFTLMVALNMAYHLPSSSVQALTWPSLSLLATLALPGLAVYFWYRNWVSAELLAQHRQANAVQHARAELKHFRDSTASQLKPLEVRQDQISQQLDAAEALVQQEDSLTDPEPADMPPESIAETSDYDLAFDRSFNETREALQERETEIANADAQNPAAEILIDASIADDESGETDQEQFTFDLDEPALVHPIAAAMSQSHAEHAHLLATEEQAAAEQLAQARAQEKLEAELLAREESVRADMNDAMQEQLKLKAEEFDRDLAESRKIAETEASLRSETEEHLRVTRKAMIKLESELQKLEASRTDEMIQLESELEKQIRKVSKAEANADREQQQRATLESELTKSRQELLEVRTEVRKNTEARAKALASANKAVAFARQAVSARAKTESELSGLKDRVLTQQTTISSLIKALETEKTRHREEVAGLKSEFAQKESELEIAAVARHNTAEAANQPLTTRLVKKVAKARPVV